MNSIHISSTTIRPIKTDYTLDTHLNIPSDHYKSVEGLEMHLNNLHFYEEDHAVNNYSNLMLTSRRSLDDFSEIQLSKSNPFPQTFSSFMIFGFSQWSVLYSPGEVPTGENADKARYLTIEELADETKVTREYTLSADSRNGQYKELYTNNKAKLPNNVLFEIELLTDTHCRISHTDTFTRTYLTYPEIGNRVCTLTFTTENSISGPDLTDVTHSQVFGYYFSRDQGRMVLYKNLSASTVGEKHNSTYITYDKSGGILRGTSTAELAEEFGTNAGWGKDTVISIRTFPEPDQNITVQNNWVRYAPDIAHTVSINQEVNEKTLDITINQGNTLELDLERWDPASRLLSEEERTLQAGQTTPGLSDCKTCIAPMSMTKLTKCYQNLDSNFLVNSEYSTLSGLTDLTMGINFTTTKNFLNPDGSQSLGNNLEVFPECDMRDYFKIHSGTNQIKGDTDITLGYQGYNTSITLKKDTVTYFHMPEDMAPYEWVNINWRKAESFPASKRPNPYFRDYVGLLEAGAIAGASPATSDKIFKRRADYRENSAWGQSHDEMGNWMCTFLKESSNPSGDRTFGRTGYIDDVVTGPLWVDRYYNTDKLTYAEAITSKTDSCYDSYANSIGSIHTYGYADVQSQLRLEPGVLYAYHHLGEAENRKIVDSLHEGMIHKDFVSYVKVTDTTETVIQPTIDVNDVRTYTFSGDSYARTVTPDKYLGNFCINFWMYQDDWSVPCGHEIVGNYLNNGIGIFNDECVTPFMYITDTDKVTITNTDLVTLNNVMSAEYMSSATDIVHVLPAAPLDDYVILKSTSTGIENSVTRFDVKGLLTESKQLTAEGAKSVLYTNKIIDTASNSDLIFTLHEGTTAVGQIRRVDLFTDLSPEKFTQVGGIVPILELSPNTSPTFTKLEVDRTGMPYKIDATDSDINVNNVIHYINNNVLYRYDTSLSGTELSGSGVVVLSGDANYVNARIDQVNSDLNGNVWVLHNNCISKYNRDNVLIKTIDISAGIEEFLNYSAAPIITGEKCFDFVNEYTSEGRKHYAVVLNDNQSPSLTGVDVIKIDAIEYVPKVIGYNNISTTISKSLSDIYNLTHFKSIKNSYDQQSPGINIKLAKEKGKYNSTNRPLTAEYDSSFDDSQNTLTFKIKLRNNFNPDDVRWVSEKLDITKLSPGWHNISISFDSWKNRLKLFIDGMLMNVHTDSLTDTGDWGRYAFTDTINGVMTIGSSPFFNSGVLSEYLRQPGHYFVNGIKIKDFRLYETVLASTHHKALSRVHAKMHDMEWTIPHGSRQYLDVIDKVFRHRLPGRKSELYDVSFINTNVVDTTLQNTLTSSLISELTGSAPIHTVLRSFHWSADGINLNTCSTDSDRYDASY